MKPVCPRTQEAQSRPGSPGAVYRPGTWDKDEAISAGPIKHPDSSEIGQGKEIGDQEVTQIWGPENCGQNLQDTRGRCSGNRMLPLGRSVAPPVYNSHGRRGAGTFFYSSSLSILGNWAT